jgi:hypothetical protein
MSTTDNEFVKFQQEALKETLGNIKEWMDDSNIENNIDFPCGVPFKYGIPLPSLNGMDDVLKAYYVNINLILDGIVACGFAHAKYLVDLFSFLCEKYPYNGEYKINLQKAEIIYDLSILRNSRQIYGPNGVNEYLLNNGLKLHHSGIIPNWTESMRLTIERALSLGINTYEYERTDRDFMEIKHCTDNNFCRAQVDYKEAVDNIIAYVDSNGVMYLVMTIRGFAPSIGGFAFCGGLVDTIGARAQESLDRCQSELEEAISENLDESIISQKRLLVLNAKNRIDELNNFQKDKLESTTYAAEAELNEEIGVEGNLSVSNIFGKPVYEITTPKMNIPNWDIRGFVPNGMTVTGFMKIYGNLPI